MTSRGFSIYVAVSRKGVWALREGEHLFISGFSRYEFYEFYPFDGFHTSNVGGEKSGTVMT